MKYYPAFINLQRGKTVVAGGGRVAERKILTLLKAGARIRIVSPSLTVNLEKLKEQGKITHVKRNYRKGDLAGAFLVIAATSSPQTNIQVARDAQHLVNVIDTPDEGNFIAPSIVKRGPLTIAISTEGSSPAVSKAVRKEIEKLYDRDFGRYLKFVEAIRRKAMKEITDRKQREKVLKFIASEEMFRTLRKEGSRKALCKILSLFKPKTASS